MSLFVTGNVYSHFRAYNKKLNELEKALVGDTELCKLATRLARVAELVDAADLKSVVH